MRQKTINVGMIGYQLMGKAHSHAYRDAPFFFNSEVTPILKTIVGRKEERVKKAAQQLGWQGYETDWEKVIKDPKIDLVDIVTPNNTHAEIAIAAARAGKHIICEKPLAMNLKEAKEMLDEVEKAGVVHMLCHNYRFAPAVQLAKKIIDEGRLGKIYHIRATFLQDWLMDPDFPLTWRLDKEISGSGTLGDLGAHIIDMARFLVGEFTEVIGIQETFIKKRPLGEMNETLQPTLGEGYGEVTVDDASAFLARFENGAMGTFEVTRFSRGNRAGNRFEVNGEKGSVRWDMENMNNLELYLEEDDKGLQGFRTINCTEPEHPYASAYWPSAHILGYEHTFVNLVSDLLNGIAKGKSPSPNFKDGVLNQAVLEAVELSIAERRWIKTAELL